MSANHWVLSRTNVSKIGDAVINIYYYTIVSRFEVRFNPRKRFVDPRPRPPPCVKKVKFFILF